MNWVAVDLGASTIKASVLDKGNNPVRLSYPMGDYTTTLLSSVVVVTEDKKVYATKDLEENLEILDKSFSF